MTEDGDIPPPPRYIGIIGLRKNGFQIIDSRYFAGKYAGINDLNF
jgi:hypothetical protein